MLPESGSFLLSGANVLYKRLRDDKKKFYNLHDSNQLEPYNFNRYFRLMSSSRPSANPPSATSPNSAACNFPWEGRTPSVPGLARASVVAAAVPAAELSNIAQPNQTPATAQNAPLLGGTGSRPSAASLAAHIALR
jgi:hypothetical protein